MHVAQVDFVVAEDFGSCPDAEELDGNRFAYASFLLSQWSGHGQHVSDGFPFVQTGQGRRAWILVLAEDSLAPEHDDHHARKHREKLRELGVRIEIQISGEDQDRDARLGRQRCRCSKRSSLVLFQRFYSGESPLRCLDCLGLVPLYEIPFDDEKHYEPHDALRSWSRNYNGCDTLQLGSQIAEKWALRQMGRHKSKLSRQGRKLCRRLEKSLGVPVFYYLHRYYGRSLKREQARQCPKCHSEWRLKEEWHGEFDFKCDRCRLLSNIAMSIG